MYQLLKSYVLFKNPDIIGIRAKAENLARAGIGIEGGRIKFS